MAYLGKTPSQAVRSRYYFTATGGETSLSGADDNANTLTFTDGNYVDVALNGVTLVAGTDYNTTTANTIGGLTALVASDVVEVIVYDTFSVFGGNMAANLNFKDNVKANFGTGNDLQIYHDGSASNIRENGTGNLQIWGDDIHFYNSAGSENIATFITNGAVKLFYDNAQKFATTSTGVDVTGTVTADGVESTCAAGDANQALLAYHPTSTSARTIAKFQSNVGGTQQDKVIINCDGSVGIGTSPSDILHIKDSASTNVLIDAPTDNASLTLQCGSSDAGAEGAFVTFIQNTTTKWQLGMNTDNSFRLYNYNTGSEALQVDSSGNLLVGTTNTDPAFNNVTGQSMASTGQLQVTRDGGTAALFNRKTGDGEIVSFRKDGGTVGSIGVDNSDNAFFSGNTTHSGIMFGTESLIPYANGSTTDATEDLGTTSLRWRNLYLSGGVYLGGTGSANHLDDYEEGTWVPQFYKGTTQVTSPTVAVGKYRKIGDLLYLNWYFIKNSGAFGSQTGNWIVKGFPFTLTPAAPYAGIPVTYFAINSVDYFTVSPHRVQVNYSDGMEVYGTQTNTDWTSGYVEIGGNGVIRLS